MMRHLLLDNPTPLFLVVFAISLLIFSKNGLTSNTLHRRVALYLGSASIFVYSAVQVMNLLRGGLLWHDEANILSISAAYTRGQAIYHPHAAAEYYSLFYGPITYLIYAPLLALFPDPLIVIRVAVFLACIAELILLYQILRFWIERCESIALLSIAVVTLLAFPGPLLGFRGDIWLLLLISAAVLIAIRRPKQSLIFWSICVGLCAAAAIDLKATTVPVLCLVIEVLHRRSGSRAATIAATTCVVAGVSIFLLPHISIANYVSWLVISSHQRFLKSTGIFNVLVTFLILTPYLAAKVIAPSGVMKWHKSSSFNTIGALAILLCIVTGSKDGAGPWHLWPLLPLLLMGAAYELHPRGGELSTLDSADQVQLFLKRRSVIIAALAVAGFVAALRSGLVDVQIMKPLVAANWKQDEADARESLLQTTEAPHRKNISMGYGENINDPRTNLRFELPLMGQEYFFDENEVVEGIKEGKPLPANVLTRILGCEDDWLIPHGERPFSVKKGEILPLIPAPYIFPDALRLGFGETHTLTHEGNVYDLWSCKADVAKL